MYSKKQRIAALIGVALLLLLYIATFVCAIFDFDGTGKLFSICLYGSIVIPLVIWGYIWIYGKLSGKKTIADFDHGTDIER